MHYKKYIIILFFLFLVVGCNYLSNPISLNMEKKNINEFFTRNGFDIKVDKTKHVPNFRIFVHYFNSSQEDINKIITNLELIEVTKKKIDEIHNCEFCQETNKIYNKVGKDFLLDANIIFYKSSKENKKAGGEIKCTIVFLFYNKTTKKSCFQTYYGWG
jgi:hypothetical protein